MSLHIFHLSQQVSLKVLSYTYFDLVAANLNSFADTQKTKQVILCGQRQEHVNLQGST